MKLPPLAPGSIIQISVVGTPMIAGVFIPDGQTMMRRVIIAAVAIEEWHKRAYALARFTMHEELWNEATESIVACRAWRDEVG